ncbi:MAG: hypothetical protein LBO76_07745 [Treponema sp.]|jgi:hypothetical protein|nr:hypothetical protein [Treponema sp.]
MKKIVIPFVALLCLVSALFAEEVTIAPLGYPSTAGNGLGGPHAAYTDGIYSLFVNPAALQWANESMITDLTFGVVGPIGKLLENMDSIAGIGESFSDGNTSAMSDALTKLTEIMPNGKLPIGADIRGPISFGYTANGLGIGLFSRTTVDARIIGLNIDATAYTDLTLPIGLSFNLLKLKDHELSAGLVLKPFARVLINKELSALDLMDEEKKDNLLKIPMPVIAGGGGDLGLMYRFKKDLVLGFAAKDVYTAGIKVYDLGSLLGAEKEESPDALYRVPLALNAGLAYTFRPSSFWKTPKAFQSFYVALMADWANLQNVFSWDDRQHRNPLLDIGGGLEIGLFSFLKFRAGVHELLPSVGIGLEPAVFKLNLALYGKELGNEPGVNSTLGVDFSISFRPDTKKKTWFWSKPLIK